MSDLKTGGRETGGRETSDCTTSDETDGRTTSDCTTSDLVTDGRTTGGRLTSGCRRLLWRGVLTTTGGVRVNGSLPPRPCVIVANHSSHADTPALLAALPAHRRPAVAAAADYWFDDARWRRYVGKSLTGAFPVRRSGGGSDDLHRAIGLLASGRDVIVFPEGTRSRDGSVGHFHGGAARLADEAGVPLVPVSIRGTGALLPVHGRPHHSRITLRIGAVATGTAAARTAIETMAAEAPERVPDWRLRVAVARFGSRPLAIWTIAGRAFTEALVWPLGRRYPAYVVIFIGLFTAALAGVVRSWS
jgi:1-acyl-sn-glycerol-3-phosphate acyltransferase